MVHLQFHYAIGLHLEDSKMASMMWWKQSHYHLKGSIVQHESTKPNNVFELHQIQF